MFSYQKSDVSGWPSWPDPRDNDWIKKTIENNDHMYVSSVPDNSRDAIFISKMVPISNFISEKLIEDELQKLNELYEKCI